MSAETLLDIFVPPEGMVGHSAALVAMTGAEDFLEEAMQRFTGLRTRPRAPVGLELAHFAFLLLADFILGRTEEIRLLRGLGRLFGEHCLADLVDLSLQQRRHCLRLAPAVLREIGDRALLGGFRASFDMRTQVGDIALYGQGQALKNAHARRNPITQCAVQLLDRGRLAGFGKGCQRAILPARVAPRGGNWDDLLVKTTRSWPKKAEPPQQHDARLRARTDNGCDPADGRPESLAEKT
jgi:hypothetical protein